MVVRALAFSVLLRIAQATVGVKIVHGVTHIYGNSFGVPGLNLTYDYIIIGGGTSGNTIAARLALAPQNYSVAVVETGSFYEILNGNRTQVPGYDYTSALSTFNGNRVQSLVAFDLSTEPQVGYQGRQIQYVQGMTLGGSSASNYMGYFRPTVGSLQHWAAEVDDDFWSWENVYPAFKRSCNFSSPDPARFTAPVLFDPNAFEQGAGPLHVSYGNFQNDYAAPLGRSLDDLGFRQLNGLNSGELIGYATSTVAIDPEYGTRSSSETSFLQLAAKQSSIKIYPNSIADRVLFDEHKKANGVLIRTNSLYQSFLYQLNANREVIVSAGAWHSPQILMLSGIGPAATLNEHGIPVIADLPGVGQNAWDQPFISTSFKVSNVTTYTQIAAGNVQANADATNQFLNQQGGPLASIGGGQAVAFEKYPVSLRQQFSNATLDYLASLPSDWPEAEYLDLAYSSFPSDLGPDDQYLQLGCAMLSPASRGNMTIRSNCILDPPRINPNWLADEGDRQQAVAALKRIRQIMNGTGFVVEPYAPPASVVTDAEILEWLQDNMSLIYHPSSTCKMGNSTDSTAVVDSRARVRGVTGLRVVDASAFPFLPPGNPMSSCYMFAEKIAESILQGY